MDYRYNINQTIDSLLTLDFLLNHQLLKNSISNLKEDLSMEKINSTRSLLSTTKIPFDIKHHIKIRLELIEDVLNDSSSNIISI